MHAAHTSSPFIFASSPAEIAGYSVFGAGAMFATGAEAGIAGNPCSVLAGSQQSLASIDRSRFAKGTVCLSWPVDQDDLSAVEPRGIADGTSLAVIGQDLPVAPTFRVACTNNGIEVRLCGHGLLATAHYWLDRLQAQVRDAVESPVATPEDGVMLLTGEQAVYVCGADMPMPFHTSELPVNSRLLSARLRLVELHVVAPPCWLVEHFIGAPGEQSIVGCAHTPGANGYLLVEFCRGTDLAMLAPFSLAMAACEQRAVIFVALVDDEGSAFAPGDRQPNAGYQAVRQRYFAPQYGNAEDAATGSAARVVASYFADRYGQLAIHQQSTSGGRLFTGLDTSQAEPYLHLIGISRRQEPEPCPD